MAEHLSAVCHEPPFVSSPPARRDSRRGTYCTVGWKISAESHIGFHVAGLYFLTHPLRQSEAPERQKAKKWEEASGSPLLLCRFQLCAKPSMYLGLAALVGFHTVVCQRALIFTINILIYSLSLPFLIFFLSLSSCAAQTLSQGRCRAMAAEEAPLPITDIRTWYSSNGFPSVGRDADGTASLCGGNFFSFTSRKFNGLQSSIMKAFYFCWSSSSF